MGFACVAGSTRKHDQGSKSEPQSGTPLRSSCACKPRHRSRKSCNPSAITTIGHSVQLQFALTTRELKLHIPEWGAGEVWSGKCGRVAALRAPCGGGVLPADNAKFRVRRRACEFSRGTVGSAGTHQPAAAARRSQARGRARPAHDAGVQGQKSTNTGMHRANASLN